jgi:hypothetical protein
MNKEMIKEKIKFIKNKIKDNKKVAIAILVVLVLAITGITAAVVSTNDKPVKRKVENVKRSIKDVDNEEVEQVTETPENTGNDAVATPNEKPSRKTFTEKNSEKQVEKKEIAKKSEKSSSTSSSNVSSKPAAKTKVWVVDRAAWTETVTKYRTETQTYTVYRNQRGMEFSTYDAAYALYASQPAGTGYAFGPVNKTRTVTVPYYEYINHPEQGHYEYR